MAQSVVEASASVLNEVGEEEEWAVEEVHLTDGKHKMSELPQSPSSPSWIALYLQGNYERTAIPPSFFYPMTLLQVLDLSHTNIKYLPKCLPKLVALKKLLLQGCQLFMELPSQIGKLKNLEELDLDETQIMDLPREIGKLLKLRHLRVSFYHVCGKKKSKLNTLLYPETISNLSQLTELSIDVNPTDKRWDDCVEAVVEEVCNSKTLRALSLYLPKFQLLDYTSIIYSSLSRFRFTVGNHKRRIISRVPHEVEAEFSNFDKCLRFVNGENIPIEIKEVLKYSTSFFLDHHATTVNLSEFGIKNMKRLKFCLLAECNKMETVIDGEVHYERNEDYQSEAAPVSIEHVLESLEYLSIYYMENLGSISRGANHCGCMFNLKFLTLHACPKLNIIFSHTLLENIVNLEEFILEDCPQVTSLIGHASVKPMMSDKIFLPSLKKLLLLYLPELVSIANGLLIAPKLESIGFYNCPKLKSISKMELSSKALTIIKGECRWWEAMNWNETEWGNRPDYLMRIFSPISNEKDVMTQLAECTDLSEATVQKERRQQGDEKLLKASLQDHKSQCSEEKTSGTYVTKSTSESILPSTPCLRTSEAPDQTWSFTSEKDECLEDSEISGVDNHEDEPKAKRWNCTENENKAFTGSASITARGDGTTLRIKSACEVLDDGYEWRKYERKIVKGGPSRSYYKCLTDGCPVKKKVERDPQDGSIFIISYEAIHNHHMPLVKRLNWLSQGEAVSVLDHAEDATEVAKTISPTKGYKDAFEVSPQDKGQHPGSGDSFEASLQDKGPHLGYEDAFEASVQDKGPDPGYRDAFGVPVQDKGPYPEYTVVPEDSIQDESRQPDGKSRGLIRTTTIHKMRGKRPTPLEQSTWNFSEPTKQPEMSLEKAGGVKSDFSPTKNISEMTPLLTNKLSNMGSQPAGYNQFNQSSLYIQGNRNVDDGYNWRKYGQKQVKGNENTFSYYKCTYPTSRTKKFVKRSLDGQITEMAYEGSHNHLKPQSTRRSSSDSACTNSEISDQSVVTSDNEQADAFLMQEDTSGSIGEDDIDHASPISNPGGEDNENEPDAKRWKGENENEGIICFGSRTVTKPRMVVQTRSNVDILDDGYRWRKYGQKVARGNPNPRSYYKCKTIGCPVRKHVERASHDPGVVITTYEGNHNHACGSSYEMNRPSTAKNSNITMPIRPSAVPSHHNTSYPNSPQTRLPPSRSQVPVTLEMLQNIGGFVFSGFEKPIGSYMNQAQVSEGAFSGAKDDQTQG